jgi:hypothetical protein
MPDISEDMDHGERIAANAGAEKEAWAATLDDMRALAAEYEEQGWETITIQAGDTTPRGDHEGGTFGLYFLTPSNKADAFVDAVEAGEFPQYEVYRAEQDGTVFLVLELLDPETETAIFVAGTFALRNSLACAKKAADEDEIYTHLHTLDGALLGSFRHADYEDFFPSITAVEDWADVDESAMNY